VQSLLLRLLIGVAVANTAYRYGGKPGLVLLCLAALALIWFRLRTLVRPCPRCHGIGSKAGSLGARKTCRACHGTGRRTAP
jgi:hypothetical protein